MLRKLLLKIRNRIYREYIKFKVRYSKYEYGLSDKPNDIPIIVSLTTFPERFGKIDLCLKSILLQKDKPDKIIVWLGSDSNKEEAEKKLSKYKKYGIDFVYDDKMNYKSHKKYIYAFKKYSDSIIITMDDDLVYPNNVITSLLKMHNRYPNAIVARRVHKITFDKDTILGYTEWEGECNTIREPSHLLLATTGAGTLFPPQSMPKMTTDFELIKDLALTADDIWLKFMALLNNTKVVWAGNRIQMPPTIKESQNLALYNINVNKNMNNIYIKKLMKKFNITKQDFYK